MDRLERRAGPPPVACRGILEAGCRRWLAAGSRSAGTVFWIGWLFEGEGEIRYGVADGGVKSVLSRKTRCASTMLPSTLTIRNVVIRPAAVLAPMAGVTDTVFRRVIRSLGGCGLIMTEFTSAEGIMRNASRTLHYLYYENDERPISAQLFGANPQALAAAAAQV